MKVFTASQVKDIDSYTITREPVKSVDLMERAAMAVTSWFERNFDSSTPISIFAGPGNNGGDALAVARLLYERHYEVKVFFIQLSSKLSEDCKTNLERLRRLCPGCIYMTDEHSGFPGFTKKDIIIDGIFGSGLSRPVTGFPAEIIRNINKSEARVIAIDIPSGLFGENNLHNISENIIRANYTLSFQFPFLSFFFAENFKYTGRYEILDIGLHPEAISRTDTTYFTLEASDIEVILKPRRKFSHKGTFGHALIISGRYGMMGASVLCARACLRGGAGLVTAHIPGSGYNILQTTVPEAITNIDESEKVFSAFPDLSSFNAVAIGPGLGCDPVTAAALKSLLETVRIPMVIDADALNILSSFKEWFDLLPENTILTPHPGEFDRMAGLSRSMYERYMKQLEFSKKYRVIIVLKGSNTIITSPDKFTWFNTTGNPGMATGGSGDVLTGLTASLLAQGYNPLEAAKTGVYLHGLAGDLSAEEHGEESMIASDIIENLGKAFLKIKQS